MSYKECTELKIFGGKKYYAYGFWGGVQQGWNYCTHFVHCGYTVLKVFIVVSPQPMAKQSLVCQGLLVIQDSRPPCIVYSGRVISPTQRPLPDDTTLTTDRHPNSQLDSNPQSHKGSGRRNTLDRAATEIGLLYALPFQKICPPQRCVM